LKIVDVDIIYWSRVRVLAPLSCTAGLRAIVSVVFSSGLFLASTSSWGFVCVANSVVDLAERAKELIKAIGREVNVLID
jgi:hypothetical protein